MKKKSLIVSGLTILALYYWFSEPGKESITPYDFSGKSDIKYFGFALTDCGKNYTSQVDDFVNLIDICPFDTKNLDERIEAASLGDNKILLHLGYIFIDIKNSTYSPSGMKYVLKKDIDSLFLEWYENNKNIDISKIAAIYLPDEPTHNGLSGDDLEKISKLLKSYFPNTPLLVIEAYSSTDTLELNQYIDWVGFDRYGTIDPTTDKDYMTAYHNVKSKMKEHQKIVVVMESQWIPYYSEEGFDESILKDMAQNYYRFAKKEGSTTAVISYLLPSDFDVKGQKGFLDLKAETQNIYKQIGSDIISSSP